MNRVTLIGHLTKDPDIRKTQSGLSVCTFSMAVQRRFQDQNGERLADFFNVVCWRGLADNCAKYTKKGSKVAVHGSLQNRSYEDKNGNKRTITEIIADEVEFCERRVETEQSQPVRQEQEYQVIDDDNLPF